MVIHMMIDLKQVIDGISRINDVDVRLVSLDQRVSCIQCELYSVVAPFPHCSHQSVELMAGW